MEDIEKQIGRNIAEYRKSAGLSQAELAKQLTAAGLKFTQQIVARVENGARPLRLSEYETLRRVLSLPPFVWALFGDDKQTEVDARIGELLRTTHQREGDLRVAATAMGLHLAEVTKFLVAIAPVDADDHRTDMLVDYLEDDWGDMVRLAILHAYDGTFRSEQWDHQDEVPGDVITPAATAERVRRGDDFRAEPPE